MVGIRPRLNKVGGGAGRPTQIITPNLWAARNDTFERTYVGRSRRVVAAHVSAVRVYGWPKAGGMYMSLFKSCRALYKYTGSGVPRQHSLSLAQ
jgi:hypothetical protein